MRAEPINNLRDALVGRKIRNSYREFMTGDARRISWLRQVAWYYGTYCPARVRGEKYAWLFFAGPSSVHPVGYGGISLEYDRFWLTAGLVPWARGRGLGRQMFDFLTYMAIGLRGEAWLKVHGWNDAARRLYEKLGYRYAGEMGGVFTMTCSLNQKGENGL